MLPFLFPCLQELGDLGWKGASMLSNPQWLGSPDGHLFTPLIFLFIFLVCHCEFFGAIPLKSKFIPTLETQISLVALAN